MDGYIGTDEDPTTLHRYLYAANSPIDRGDPSGLFFASFSVAASLSSTINAISIPSLQAAILTTKKQLGSYKMDYNGLHLRVLERGTGAVVAAYEALTGDPNFGWADSVSRAGPTPPARYRINKSDVQRLNGSMGGAWGIGRVLLQKDDDLRKFFGRSGFYLHGGKLADPNGFPWYTHGCIKVVDDDWEEIIEEYVEGNTQSSLSLEIDYTAQPHFRP